MNRRRLRSGLGASYISLVPLTINTLLTKCQPPTEMLEYLLDQIIRGLWIVGGGRRISGLKQKLLGSIAAIAAVNVLEWFMDIERHADNTKLAWVVGILLAFAVSMLILDGYMHVDSPVSRRCHQLSRGRRKL